MVTKLFTFAPATTISSSQVNAVLDQAFAQLNINIADISTNQTDIASRALSSALALVTIRAFGSNPVDSDSLEDRVFDTDDDTSIYNRCFKAALGTSLQAQINTEEARIDVIEPKINAVETHQNSTFAAALASYVGLVIKTWDKSEGVYAADYGVPGGTGQVYRYTCTDWIIPIVSQGDLKNNCPWPADLIGGDVVTGLSGTGSNCAGWEFEVGHTDPPKLVLGKKSYTDEIGSRLALLVFYNDS